jgi:hypothetical protein
MHGLTVQSASGYDWGVRAAVPLPPSAWLMLSGLALIAAWMRRPSR